VARGPRSGTIIHKLQGIYASVLPSSQGNRATHVSDGADPTHNVHGDSCGDNDRIIGLNDKHEEK